MIPKIIHYVWLGGEEPQKVKDCIATWKRFNPDYQIRRWDESNFDLNAFPFAREAYEEKKFSFAADVIRVYALCAEGGIYLDTDVLCFKSFDDLLSEKLVLGYENPHYFGTATLLCEKGCKVMEALLEVYRQRKFVLYKKGEKLLNTVSINMLLTEVFFKANGLRYLLNGNYDIGGARLLDIEYFSPPYWTKERPPEACITPGKTYTLHLFEGSWKTDILLTKGQRFSLRAKRYLIFHFPRLWGNLKMIRMEESMYQKGHEYTRKNLKKGKKDLIKFV